MIARPPGGRGPRGFTLIELILVIVVVSIAAVVLLELFTGVAESLGANEDIQAATQLAQECGEHVLTVRRDPAAGFAAVTATVCDALPAPPAGFTRQVEVSDLTNSPPCTVTTAGTCKRIVVSVAKGPVGAAVTLMVVAY